MSKITERWHQFANGAPPLAIATTFGVIVLGALSALDVLSSDTAGGIAAALLGVVTLILLRFWSLDKKIDKLQESLDASQDPCSYRLTKESVTWEFISRQPDVATSTVTRNVRLNHEGISVHEYRTTGHGGAETESIESIRWRRLGDTQWSKTPEPRKYLSQKREMVWQVFLDADLPAKSEIELEIVRKMKGRFPNPSEEITNVTKVYSAPHRLLKVIWPLDVDVSDLRVQRADGSAVTVQSARKHGRHQFETLEPTGDPGDEITLSWHW